MCSGHLVSRMNMKGCDMTHEQRIAVKEYAAKHGRFWKQKLLLAWQTGRDTDEPHGWALRELRNAGGTAWLAKVKV